MKIVWTNPAIADLESIRDYIAFPKTLRATSLMVGSPSPLDPEQLGELGIRWVEETKE